MDFFETIYTASRRGEKIVADYIKIIGTNQAPCRSATFETSRQRDGIFQGRKLMVKMESAE
jgi:hypothetical protein